MTLQAGDLVEFTSLCSAHVWQAVILGFCFKDRTVAIVTDDSGRPPRPVSVGRLRRGTITYTHSGYSA